MAIPITRFSIDKWLDPYDRPARLYPGLLVLLPFIVFVAVTWGPKYPASTTLASVLVACGGPYLLASMVRIWGLHAQENLVERWGGMPSTILLRFRDSGLPPQTKQRYRELITAKLGLDMPTEADEAAEALMADQAYIAAADALRPLTNDRSKFGLLFKELVQYGFNRNAHGARWVGFGSALLVMLVVGFRSHVLSINAGFLHTDLVGAWGIPEWLTIGVSVLMMLIWSFHFTGDTVKRSGFAYGRRLWEALEQVAKKPTRRKSG